MKFPSFRAAAIFLSEDFFAPDPECPMVDDYQKDINNQILQ
ncbi:hypothetical protein ACFL5V_07610 [Fibrobacterota bacterium]